MSNVVLRRRNKFIFLGIDLFCIFLAFVLAFLVRFDEIPQRNFDSFFSLLPWILLVSLLFLSVYEIYNIQRKNMWDIFRDILVANTFIVFITMAFSFLFREFALPRTVIVIAYAFSILLMLFWKTIVVNFNPLKRVDKILLIGPSSEMNKLVGDLTSTFGSKAEIICVEPEKIGSKLIDLIKAVNMVAISPSLNEGLKTKIIYESMSKSKNVSIVPSAYDLILTKANITSFEDSMLLSVKPLGLSLDQQLVKRIFDLFLGVVTMILVSPLCLMAIILIKIESPTGSVLYGQKRLGRYNKEFTILKFRTMIENAEKNTGPVLATADDNRITKIGKFLRMTRIDEIPQLVNVIKGDMSIVGPRPEREHFVREFEKEHESYKYRSTVKPGITGIAQVMGNYSTSVEDKLRFDLYYIRNYSIWMDFVLLLRTIIVVLDKTKSEGTKTKVTTPRTVEGNKNVI